MDKNTMEVNGNWTGLVVNILQNIIFYVPQKKNGGIDVGGVLWTRPLKHVYLFIMLSAHVEVDLSLREYAAFFNFHFLFDWI